MPDIKRILLSRMRFIGDVVLTTPVIRAVRERYPDAFIAYLGERSAVSLLERNPHLDEILPYDFSRPDILEQARMIVALRRLRFDAVVDFFSNPRTALLMRASGAAMRIGKDSRGRGGLYTHRIEDDGKPKTAVEFHYRYVRPLGVEPTAYMTEIVLGPEEKEEARRFLSGIGIDLRRPVVGLHPGATWPAKIWPAEKFAAVARILAAEGRQVVLTQGPNDADAVRDVVALAGGHVTSVPVLPLRRLAAVLSHLNTYVANDNGTMHIAVAVGTRTIGIFGPGEEQIWFPYLPPYYPASAGHLVFRKNVPCHPCHLDHCNRQGEEYLECMKLLTAEEVAAAVTTGAAGQS